MKRSLGTPILVLAIAVGVVAGRASTGIAKDSGGKVAAQPKVAKGQKSSSSSPAVPAGVTVNACGCYRTETGACFCGNKEGHCACPGDCEPMGCEQKRAKEIQREVAAETKKAQDEEKKRQTEAATAEAAAAAAARADAGPPATEEAASEDTDTNEAVEKKADEPKPEKRTSKAKGRKRRVAKP